MLLLLLLPGPGPAARCWVSAVRGPAVITTYQLATYHEARAVNPLGIRPPPRQPLPVANSINNNKNTALELKTQNVEHQVLIRTSMELKFG